MDRVEVHKGSYLSAPHASRVNGNAGIAPVVADPRDPRDVRYAPDRAKFPPLNCACGGTVTDACDNCGIPRAIFIVRTARLFADLRRDPAEKRARAMVGLGVAAILLGVGAWIAVPEYAVVACIVPLVLGSLFVGAGIVARRGR